jgi:hypothetical protein
MRAPIAEMRTTADRASISSRMSARRTTMTMIEARSPGSAEL